MSSNDNPASTLSLDPQADETRMRRALGLGGGSPQVHQQRPEQARQRHRFAQDGSVPVVMLSRHGDHDPGGLKDRVAALEAALEAERAAHALTRRTLQESQAAHQAAQTRLAHATLAHTEALSVERRARKAAEEALAAIPPTPVPVPTSIAKPVEVVVEKVERAPRKPRANAAPREMKPVRWWTPGYRAKLKS